MNARSTLNSVGKIGDGKVTNYDPEHCEHHHEWSEGQSIAYMNPASRAAVARALGKSPDDLEIAGSKVLADSKIFDTMVHFPGPNNKCTRYHV